MGWGGNHFRKELGRFGLSLDYLLALGVMMGVL